MFSLRLLTTASRRSFTTSTIARKDFIQELYVKELKAYKPNPAAADPLGAVKSYSTPSVPTAPILLDAAGLAAELSAYDSDVATPDVAASVSADAHAHEGAAEEGADEYLKLVEADVVKSGAHH